MCATCHCKTGIYFISYLFTGFFNRRINIFPDFKKYWNSYSDVGDIISLSTQSWWLTKQNLSPKLKLSSNFRNCPECLFLSSFFTRFVSDLILSRISCESRSISWIRNEPSKFNVSVDRTSLLSRRPMSREFVLLGAPMECELLNSSKLIADWLKILLMTSLSRLRSRVRSRFWSVEAFCCGTMSGVVVVCLFGELSLTTRGCSVSY